MLYSTFLIAAIGRLFRANFQMVSFLSFMIDHFVQIKYLRKALPAVELNWQLREHACNNLFSGSNLSCEQKLRTVISWTRYSRNFLITRTISETTIKKMPAMENAREIRENKASRKPPNKVLGFPSSTSCIIAMLDKFDSIYRGL